MPNLLAAKPRTETRVKESSVTLLCRRRQEGAMVITFASNRPALREAQTSIQWKLCNQHAVQCSAVQCRASSRSCAVQFTC